MPARGFLARGVRVEVEVEAGRFDLKQPLQATSVWTFGDSILTRVTARSTTNAQMASLIRTLAKMDFCGTKLSKHATGRPTFNAFLDKILEDSQAGKTP